MSILASSRIASLPHRGRGAGVEAGVPPPLAGEEHEKQDEHRNKQYVKHVTPPS